MIKEFRQQKGWSQQKLSELTGVSRSTIRNIENGITKNSPKKDKLEAYITSYLSRETLHNMMCERYGKTFDLVDDKGRKELTKILFPEEKKSIWKKIKDWWLK